MNDLYKDDTLNCLNWLDAQKSSMIGLLIKWSNINSGSQHLIGLKAMLDALKLEFGQLNGIIQTLSLPKRKIINSSGDTVLIESAQALHVKKINKKATLKLLLCGHMDTVYSSDHPFQTCRQIAVDKLVGPGVADMKGGLVIMLMVLLALEKHPVNKWIHWELLITPDEEIGSPASHHLLKKVASQHDIGLIFEPSFSDGAIISSRKGSANFIIIVRGKAAHAGRDFIHGKNAINALAHLIVELETYQANNSNKSTINVGSIYGGRAVNIVPDFARCEVNIRAEKMHDLKQAITVLHHLAKTHEKNDISFTIHSHSIRPPKRFDLKTLKLYAALKRCEDDDDLITYRPSGGVTDGNTLQSHGLSCIDSLGVIGGNSHTTDEYALLDSLSKRAKLTLKLLIHLAIKTRKDT